jgi:hypothetical protein
MARPDEENRYLHNPFIAPPTHEEPSLPEPLSSVDRPHERVVVLEIDGAKKVFDDRVVIEYVSDVHGEYPANLRITREVPVGITVERTGDEVYDPDPAKAGRIGEFVSTFIGLRPSRPRFFIGERYEVELVRRTESGIEFTMRSTHQLNERTIPGQVDGRDVLKALWRERQRRSSKSRRPR